LSIAIVDGAVNSTHPSLRGCRMSTVGDSTSTVAGEHATFLASILVGSGADRDSGRVLGLCPGGTLVNFALVTDAMLTVMPIRNVAAVLASAVSHAVARGCRVILFGIEIRGAESRAWQPLRESLRAAVVAGSVVVLPAGNRAGAPARTPCCWPEALVAASHDWRGRVSSFSPLRGQCGNTILAPGENVPGAGPGSTYVVRSGTSFAAAVAAGSLALATCLAPGRATVDLAAALCPPPTRILNAAALLTERPSCSEREEQHAIADARTTLDRRNSPGPSFRATSRRLVL
jgi:subtilisin family serine protease